MRTSTKLIIGASIVVGAALAFVPGPLTKALVLRELRRTTGFEVSYKRIESKPWQRTLDIEDLVFRNPPEFHEPVAIEIRRLHARYQWRKLFGDRVELDELALDVPRVVLVRLANGDSNLERMQAAAQGSRTAGASASAPPAAAPNAQLNPAPPKDEWAAALAAADLEPATAPAAPAAAPAPASPPAASPAAPGEQPDLRIGRLNLKLGQVEIVDYGRMKKGQPKRQTQALNVEQTFENVTDLDAVAQQLAAQVLVQEGLRAVTEQLNDPEVMEKLNKNLDKLSEKLGDLFK